MSNYDFFTHFSCLFDVGSPGNAVRALDIYKSYETELERDDERSVGFQLSIDKHSDSALWIRSDESGEPGDVVAFVLRCAEALNLKGRWGFAWAHTCSKPQIDAFGGGACAVDLGSRKTIGRISCSRWLETELAGPEPWPPAR